MDGVRNAAICDQLGLTLPAVKCRLRRAKRLMRRLLTPHFDPAAERANP